MADIDHFGPQNLPLDIFYELLLKYNDIEKALELIKTCKREKEFETDIGLVNKLCDHYSLCRPLSILDQVKENFALSDIESLFQAVRRNNEQVFYEALDKITFKSDSYRSLLQLLNCALSFRRNQFYISILRKFQFMIGIIIEHSEELVLSNEIEIIEYILDHRGSNAIRLLETAIKNNAIDIVKCFLKREDLIKSILQSKFDVFCGNESNYKNEHEMISILSESIEKHYGDTLINYIIKKTSNELGLRLLINFRSTKVTDRLRVLIRLIHLGKRNSDLICSVLRSWQHLNKNQMKIFLNLNYPEVTSMIVRFRHLKLMKRLIIDNLDLWPSMIRLWSHEGRFILNGGPISMSANSNYEIMATIITNRREDFSDLIRISTDNEINYIRDIIINLENKWFIERIEELVEEREFITKFIDNPEKITSYISKGICLKLNICQCLILIRSISLSDIENKRYILEILMETFVDNMHNPSIGDTENCECFKFFTRDDIIDRLIVHESLDEMLEYIQKNLDIKDEFNCFIYSNPEIVLPEDEYDDKEDIEKIVPVLKAM